MVPGGCRALTEKAGPWIAEIAKLSIRRDILVL